MLVEELDKLRRSVDQLIIWIKMGCVVFILLLLVVLDMKSDIRVNRITSSNNKTAIRVHVEHHKGKETVGHDERSDETKPIQQRQ